MFTFPPASIQTPRLLLRRPHVDDAQLAFARWCQDPEVARFLAWAPHTAIAQTHAYLEKTIDAWENGCGYRDWVIELEGEVVGMIGTRVDNHRVEIGYVISRSFWGRGIVTEATEAVIRAAFDDPTIHRVRALCDAANGASARVMEKAGLRFEGLMRAFAPHPNVGPEPRDCLLYARGREDIPLIAQALTTGRGATCDAALRALPDWFGIEDAIARYTRDVEQMQCWVTRGDLSPTGFLAVERHAHRSAEVHVMGVLPAHQGRGHGAALLRAAEEALARDGVRYLQVKTLSAAHPDPFYARTRHFYARQGFEPLTELPTLWGPQNPCLQMIKRI